jgi:UDP-2-acetamido-2-deoxy-ribo-hexuluronate aminotransferase
MDFIDLAAQQKRIKASINRNIQKVLKHGQYIMGPEITELEKTLAGYVEAKHALACASGTEALLMALMAYDIGPGDAVFVPVFTFIATAEVVSLLGATPVFVDIDPKTFNMDTSKLEAAVNSIKIKNPLLKPRGIIPVDLFGLPADYEAITAIAAKQDLFVIEDAAQSFGAEYYGKKTCSLGHISCTSFFPAKPLGCYGDGGMCFTDDDALANIMYSIRVHGQGTDKYENVRIGINGRLDSIQAAVLLAKFSIFPDEIEKRHAIARNYAKQLRRSSLMTPVIPNGYKSAWAQYSVLAKDQNQRGAIISDLKEAGIPTAIYYPIPLHLQNAYRDLGYKPGDFPASEDIAGRIFSLPMHPYLKKKDQLLITECLVSKTCRRS